MELKNKIVVITGASQGIGAAIARKFSKEGTKIVLCYRNNQIGARTILKYIQQFSKDSITFMGDLSDEKTVKKLFETINQNFGQIDILINNAGKSNPKNILKTSKQDWLEAFDNNFFTTVLCSKYALKIMETQDRGKIINTSSINGLEHVGRPGNIAYSVAKAAIINFTKTLAKEFAPKIFVNAVAPGITQTDYWNTVDEDFKQRTLQGIPIQRFIQPEEIADIFLFLAKNDSLTGEVIVADGGFNLKNYS